MISKAASTPLGHIGVAGVEDEVEIEVRQRLELQQPLGGGELVGNVLQQDLDAALAGENAELFERGEGGVHLALVELLAGDADVLDHVMEGNDLGDFDGALDLVHHAAMRLAFTVSVMVTTACGPERPQISSVYMGEWSECRLQLGVAEPVAEFGDLRLVAIVEVLAGAENLDRGNARLLDPC